MGGTVQNLTESERAEVAFHVRLPGNAVILLAGILAQLEWVLPACGEGMRSGAIIPPLFIGESGGASKPPGYSSFLIFVSSGSVIWNWSSLRVMFSFTLSTVKTI